MRLRPGRGTDDTLLELLEEAGRNAEEAARLLRQLLAEHPDRGELQAELVRCEHRGDRLTHDIIHRLNGGGSARPPLDVADGHALAGALDDIVDETEQAGDWLVLYGIEAPMEQAIALADVLVRAAAAVARALGALRAGRDLGEHLVEVHELENEGDRVFRASVAAVFAAGIDPMFVIRWKDVFAGLEAAIDACEHVAHVLEGMALKRRRNRG